MPKTNSKTKKQTTTKKSTPKTKEPKTAIGEKQLKSKPLWSVFLITLAVLVFAALLDYDPLQSPVVTSDAEERNIVGQFGAIVGFRLFQVFGFGAWIIPACLLRISFLCVYKSSEHLKFKRALNLILLLIAIAGIGNMMQFGVLEESYSNVKPGVHNIENPNNPYYTYPSGHGGLIGTYLYEKTMRDAVGSFGSGLIYTMMFLVGLVFSFLSEPMPTFSKIYRRSNVLYREWQEKRAEWKAKKQEFLDRHTVVSEYGDADVVESEKKSKPITVVAPVEEPEPVKAAKVDIFVDNQKFDEPKKTKAAKAKAEPKVVEPEPVPEPAPEPVKAPEPTPEPLAAKAKEEPKKEEANKKITLFGREKVEKTNSTIPKRIGNYKFPGLNLLVDPPPEKTMDAQNFQDTADALVQTLKEFKVEVNPGEVHSGPVITRYEVTPAPGVRVEKIESLDKNIALGLKAEAVRILAPVPGKGTVGIEVPNKVAAPVCLKEIIESKAWAEGDAEIPIVLGKEVTGKPIVVDLTKMPHMLIAGSTGSGKTVCINTVIASLLYKMSPDDLRFIMVDPKVVEMQGYNDLPHMLIPVVTEPKKVPGALKWLISEMERRFQVFAEVGVRNIAGFNAKIAKDKSGEKKAEAQAAELTPEERAALTNIEVPRDEGVEVPKTKLPFIVCIIDELADLMMVAPADIETGIARLAQLARAAGIHLILATQRPSVNVITGVIKANLPCRIAFRVASATDSRTILDSKGAESLIGKGDLLFTPPGSAFLVRAQGAFVSDEEINGIVDYLKVNGPPIFAEDVLAKIESEGEEGGGGEGGEWDDELVPAAIDVVKNTKRASTSMIQRRLKIGYNRAARIMEILEEEGMVGPENGSKPREILMDI